MLGDRLRSGPDRARRSPSRSPPKCQTIIGVRCAHHSRPCDRHAHSGSVRQLRRMAAIGPRTTSSVLVRPRPCAAVCRPERRPLPTRQLLLMKSGDHGMRLPHRSGSRHRPARSRRVRADKPLPAQDDKRRPSIGRRLSAFATARRLNRPMIRLDLVLTSLRRNSAETAKSPAPECRSAFQHGLRNSPSLRDPAPLA